MFLTGTRTTPLPQSPAPVPSSPSSLSPSMRNPLLLQPPLGAVAPPLMHVPPPPACANSTIPSVPRPLRRSASLPRTSRVPRPPLSPLPILVSIPPSVVRIGQPYILCARTHTRSPARSHTVARCRALSHAFVRPSPFSPDPLSHPLAALPEPSRFSGFTCPVLSHTHAPFLGGGHRGTAVRTGIIPHPG